MSDEDFMNLKYPYTNEVLLNYIVINKNVSSNYESALEKTNLSYQIIGDIDIKKVIQIISLIQ